MHRNFNKKHAEESHYHANFDSNFDYINLDIRILPTLMYQVDLCYTDTPLSGDYLQW